MIGSKKDNRRNGGRKAASRGREWRAVMAVLALVWALSLAPARLVHAADSVDFSYVEQDIANWKAVYEPVLEAKGTLSSRKLAERQSRNLDVTDAVEGIYANVTDTKKSTSVLKTDKALMLYDVLNGNYSRKAVEAFLDHGYFTEYYKDLKNAGLVDEDYRLPSKSYSIEVLDETVTVPGEETDTTYKMIKTDSEYLDTEQLLTVARSTKDKKTVRSLEKKIASFEDNYSPKGSGK